MCILTERRCQCSSSYNNMCFQIENCFFLSTSHTQRRISFYITSKWKSLGKRIVHSMVLQHSCAFCGGRLNLTQRKSEKEKHSGWLYIFILRYTAHITLHPFDVHMPTNWKQCTCAASAGQFQLTGSSLKNRKGEDSCITLFSFPLLGICHYKFFALFISLSEFFHRSVRDVMRNLELKTHNIFSFISGALLWTSSV